MGEFDLDVLLSDERAKVLRQRADTLKSDRIVERSWDKIPNGAQEEIRARFATLKTYTDPVIDDTTFTGTWRSAFARFEPNGGGLRLIEELRFGWLQTVLSGGSVDWSEARLVSGTDVDQSEGIRILEWRNVAEDKVESIMDELTAATYTNVSADGEAITGTWNNVRVESDKDEDGSGIIRILLATNERVETATVDDGTLSPATIARYYNVPDERISTVLALAATAGTRVNASSRVLNYNDGFATIALETTNIEAAQTQESIGVNANTTALIDHRWNQTLEEIDQFIVDNSFTEKTEGVTRDLRHFSNGNKTWDMLATVRTVDMRNSITAGDFQNIDADELNRRDPGTEAEVRRYLWVNVRASAITTARQALTTAPSGWSLLDIDERFNDSLQVYNVLWTIEISGSTRWDVEFREAGGEAEVRTIQLRNRPNASPPADPDPDDGFLITARQINDPDTVHGDYIYTQERIGTTEHQVEIRNTGAEAETIRVELLRRQGVPTTPVLSGYKLMDSGIREAGAVLPDYWYILKKIGTTNHLTSTRESGSRVEVRTVELLQRNGAPSPAPTAPAGFILIHDVVRNPDSPLQDYLYEYHKTNSTSLEVRVRWPGLDAETILETIHGAQTVPAPAPQKAGYTLIDIQIENAAALLKNITYAYSLDSVRTGIGIRYIGTLNPYFMRRDLYVDANVPDVNLTARVNFLADASNWGVREIPVSVRPQYSGRGQTDIYVTVLVLPGAFSNRIDNVDKFDGIFKATGFTIIPQSVLYPTSHDTGSGTVTGWGSASEIRAVGNAGNLGRQVRSQKGVETVSFHKTEPSTSDPTGAFTSYTYEVKRKDQELGFWTKRVVQIDTGTWETTL